MENKRKIIVIILCLFGFLVWTLLYYLKLLNGFDEYIYNLIHQFHNSYLDSFFKVITKFGNTIPVILFSFVLVLALKKKNRFYLISSMLITFLSNQAIKYLVKRPRPPLERRLIKQGGFSYPSGHSMMSLCLYGFLIYLIYKAVKNKRLKIFLITILVVLILLIGISRIYVGVHYPSDVVGAYLLSIGLLIGDIIFINHLFKGETNNDQNVSN